ncbi:MAG TPA: hypothetical protein VGM01_06280 [Ktedonobacteraceae bacterium]|jgi:hypothetical protein
MLIIISILIPGCASTQSVSQKGTTSPITITNVLSPTPTPLFTVTASTSSATVSTPEDGITVHVDINGTYSISTASPAWTFGGTVGHPLEHITVDNAKDNLGSYREIRFTYQGQVARMSSIRVYGSRPVVLFSTTYMQAGSNTEPFPIFTTYPQNLYHLSHNGSFGIARFNLAGTDSPWLFFDKHANSLILSPAANFMVATLKLGSSGVIASGINNGIESVPQGFTHRTMLTVGNGINNTYNLWGHAMTDLQGKIRVANDSNVTLNKLGYWTDRGATYYYNYIPSKGYAGTLEAVAQNFAEQGIPLGYMQLDSWWYDKSSPPGWNKGNGGIYTYTASPELFPNGLGAFQQTVNLPLVVHGRWIDTNSPYRTQYSMSGNVSTDPRYWQSIMRYLRANGVVTYEQDWLSAQAHSLNNLNDPNAWMSAMANAASQYGLSLQYCMADPHHFLQSSMYDAVVTARVSDDHFVRARWDNFLYDSRLASSLGLWPWADVFMSTQTDNLLLSTLSAGMVGVGDALGAESKTNLMQTIRTDGVIVKPDTSIVPVDATYIADAQGQNSPMVAAAYSYHNKLTAAYVFAYSRTSPTSQTATITPASLGITGDAYVYNYFSGSGTVVKAGQSFTSNVNAGSYFVVVPIGASGIAFLGDAGKFVSLGSKRISSLSDDGSVHATVAFAAGEGPVTLHGYAPTQPMVVPSNGSASPVTYNPTTHLFSVTVSAGKSNSATIRLSLI